MGIGPFPGASSGGSSTPLPANIVIGPGTTVTDNALVRWDGTTGTLVQNSTGILTDAGQLTVTTLVVGSPYAASIAYAANVTSTAALYTTSTLGDGTILIGKVPSNGTCIMSNTAADNTSTNNSVGTLMQANLFGFFFYLSDATAIGAARSFNLALSIATDYSVRVGGYTTQSEFRVLEPTGTGSRYVMMRMAHEGATFQSDTTTFMYARAGVSKGDVGFGVTQKISAHTIQPQAQVTLTGTTTINSSTTMTGSGTLFLEELSEMDRVSVSSASSTFRPVMTISSNTSLTVQTNLGNGTSQTIARRRAIQVWKDVSASVVGGITDTGNFLIGNNNSSGLYSSGLLYGALTVNNSISATTIASFFNSGSWKAHINTSGVYKYLVGTNTNDVQYPVTGAVLYNSSQRHTTTGAGGNDLLDSFQVEGQLLGSNNERAHIKVIAYGVCASATGNIILQLGGNTIATLPIGALDTKWRAMFEVAADPNNINGVTCAGMMTTDSGPSSFVDVQELSLDMSDGRALDLYGDDGGTGTITEWYFSAEYVNDSNI